MAFKSSDFFRGFFIFLADSVTFLVAKRFIINDVI